MRSIAGIAFALTLVGIFFWAITPTLFDWQLRQFDTFQRRRFVLFSRVAMVVVLVVAFIALARIAPPAGTP